MRRLPLAWIGESQVAPELSAMHGRFRRALSVSPADLFHNPAEEGLTAEIQYDHIRRRFISGGLRSRMARNGWDTLWCAIEGRNARESRWWLREDVDDADILEASWKFAELARFLREDVLSEEIPEAKVCFHNTPRLPSYRAWREKEAVLARWELMDQAFVAAAAVGVRASYPGSPRDDPAAYRSFIGEVTAGFTGRFAAVTEFWPTASQLRGHGGSAVPAGWYRELLQVMHDSGADGIAVWDAAEDGVQLERPRWPELIDFISGNELSPGPRGTR